MRVRKILECLVCVIMIGRRQDRPWEGRNISLTPVLPGVNPTIPSQSLSLAHSRKTSTGIQGSIYGLRCRSGPALQTPVGLYTATAAVQSFS